MDYTEAQREIEYWSRSMAAWLHFAVCEADRMDRAEYLHCKRNAYRASDRISEAMSAIDWANSWVTDRPFSELENIEYV